MRVGLQQGFLLNIFRVFPDARDAKRETESASPRVLEIPSGNLAGNGAFALTVIPNRDGVVRPDIRGRRG
jgi:hypothetical protein